MPPRRWVQVPADEEPPPYPDITLDKALQRATCRASSSSRSSQLSPPSAVLKRLSTVLLSGSRSRVALCYSTPVPRLRGSARKRGKVHRVNLIECRGVNKFFGDFQVLEDIDFTVDEGEVVVVIGPSGSGKSTLLRCINGLEENTSGELVVDGMQLHERTTSLNKLRSEIGMVFQQFDLYPHMTVAENIKLA